MSTSLTVFEILESSRPGLNLRLNEDEVKGVKDAKLKTDKALRDAGGRVNGGDVVGGEEEEDWEEGFQLELDD